MDPLELPLVPGPEPAGDGERSDTLVATIVSFALPLMYLALLTVTDLTKQPQVSVLYGPMAVGAVGALVCLLTRPRFGHAVVAVIACAWWCLVAGLTMVAIDILIFPFQDAREMYSSERPLNESAGGFAAIALLPLIDLIVILGLGIDPGSNAALLALPLAFAPVAYAVNRLLSVPAAWAVVHAGGCVAACFGVAAAVGIVEGLFFAW